MPGFHAALLFQQVHTSENFYKLSAPTTLYGRFAQFVALIFGCGLESPDDYGRLHYHDLKPKGYTP